MITPYSGIDIPMSLLELSGLEASEELMFFSKPLLELSGLVVSEELEPVSLPVVSLELDTGFSAGSL